jgi:hypothetical protein
MTLVGVAFDATVRLYIKCGHDEELTAKSQQLMANS